MITHKLINWQVSDTYKDENALINKLSIYQGGIENRFIPNLSNETKHLIEGLFKISNDENLRKFALSSPDDVVKTEDDQMLEKVMFSSTDSEFENFTDLSCRCLQ